MIFEVQPNQIEGLDSTTMVQLLRLLLHAEAQKAGIDLRAVSVPLQIATSDGGEDARISWSDGLAQTDYLPSRYCVFQSKASNLGPSAWKKEVWTRPSRRNGAVRRLNEVIVQALSQRGAYVGFTSAALVGPRYDERIAAIKNGISEAGADPDALSAIDIYDANKIAQWCSRHPSVAVWLNERTSGLDLGGFRTIDGWGRQGENASIPLATDNATRYLLDETTGATGERGAPARNDLNFQQIKDRLITHLALPGRCVRVFGPSGVGKSRFAYEVFNDTSTLANTSTATAAVYCDLRMVGHGPLLSVARSLAQEAIPSILVVDECSRETAVALADAASEEGSLLRILTIDTDERPIQGEKWLNVSVGRSDDQLIETIVRQRLPRADNITIGYIKSLCGGFPRIAVLATQNIASQVPVLKSLDDVVERVLEGCRIADGDQLRAIECLALFEKLGADEELADQFNFVAESLAGLTGDRMYEHIARASRSHIIDRRGRYWRVQPEPIAAFLGARRLDLLRLTTINKFVETAPPRLLLEFFKQWRSFDNTRSAPAIAHQLLAPEGSYGSFETINTEVGSAILDALVHVAPDTVAETLARILGALSTEQLLEFKAGRRNVIWALSKLVFRQETFGVAARLTLRLGAAENEKWGNNASGLFKNLFQLRLSGTEATPAERFAVLDEGLASADPAIALLCIEALADTLQQGHFSRSSGAEQIGSAMPRRDWHPETWEDVFDFHRQGLSRLQRARALGGDAASKCEKAIADHLRGLLSNEPLLEQISDIVTSIAREKGIWLEAIRSVGDWLYFDRRGAPADFSKKIRALYDSLFPTDLVQQVLLYTKFWSAQIRNPDSMYGPDGTFERDYDYSARKARELAGQVAGDKDLTKRILSELAPQELHNAFPFAHELGLKTPDPIGTFTTAIEAYEGATQARSMQLIRGLLSGIDKRDTANGDTCLQLGLASAVLQQHALDLYTAIELSPERLGEIVAALREGRIQADYCAQLSYGRGLDHFTPTQLRPLIDELESNHGGIGVWTALEIVSMYQHGRGTLDPGLEAIAKQLLVTPRLFEKTERRDRDGYLVESLVELIANKGTLDDEFVGLMGGQIIRLCQTQNYDLFHALDGPARKLIAIFVSNASTAIWRSLARFFEIATPLEKHQLKELIGPGHGGESYQGKGVLYGLPEDQMFAWADVDPVNRAPFLVMFYPLLEEVKPDPPIWHEAMERLANRYGAQPSFRQQLTMRLRPSSWWGSLVPFLAALMIPLEKWFTHPVPGLAHWARTKYLQLQRQIEAEQRRDDENDLS